MTLEITKFINDNSDWEAKLADAPYFVKTKRTGDFVLLKYSQLNSDFNLPIVRECRGIILDESDNYRPVCVPFFKFGNVGERYVPEIDWTTARVQEKIDGSLIKVWHHKGMWRISSNGEIDARNANIYSTPMAKVPSTNLRTLFDEAWSKTGVAMNSLNKDYTYMFELTSPHNRVIVRYEETTIRHIGTRNNHTLFECDMDIGVLKPLIFPFAALTECIESAKQLGHSDEGYVVTDQHFNRVKLKSPSYVALSYLAQGVTTHTKVVEIIQKNEQSEFLSYFPEYKDIFDEALRLIDEFSARQSVELEEIRAKQFASRKELAEAVAKSDCPECLFVLIDGKEPNARSWLLSRPAAKVLRYIGLEGD